MPRDDPSIVRIDGVLLERLLRDLLGERVSIAAATELAGGRYNLTVGIRLAGARRVVLRAAPPESQQFHSERHLMRNEVAAADTIRTIAAVPHILASDFSHRLVDRDLLVQSWIPGTPAIDALVAGGEPIAIRLWHQIGETLACLHQRRGDRFGRFTGPQARSWSEQLTTAFEDLRHDFETAELDPTPLRNCLETIARHRDALDTTRPRLLHGDLGPGNVMVRAADDPTITGLIDCDRSWWGDPLADWTFYLVNRRRPEQQKAFWAGYGGQSSEDLDELHRIKSLLYLARSEAEASLELHRLDEIAKLHSSQMSLAAVSKRLRRTGCGSST